MSRQFDTSGGADSITFSPGGAPPDQGPITIAVLAKAFSTVGWTGWMVAGRKTGTAVLGFLTSNNAGAKLFAENDFGNGVSGLSTSWRWYVMRKAAGNVQPTISVWDLSGAWSHTANSANVGDGTGPIDTLYVGSQNGSGNGWRGSIAMVAMWTAALTDGQVEARMTLNARDAYNASPSWMIRLNQASTATSVTDDTGGGGDQSAISGTSVDADDPPGFNYALTSNVDGTASQTVTFTGTAAGQVDRSTSAAQTATFAGTAVADVQRGTTAAQMASFTGTAAAQVIANATAAQTILLPGTVVPEPDAAPAARQGNWNSLLSIYRQNEADTRAFLAKTITECPNHLYPLEPGRSPGTLHCRFGGELFDMHGNPALI